MELKNQFMSKAKQFMDDTSIGELKELKDGKKLLKKFLGQEEDDAPVEEPESIPEDWEDEEYDDWEEEEEFDMSEPEKIRVGYMKPGSAPPPPKKTLEDARDESFDLKMGNLSGLLTRFGAEGAEEVQEEVKPTARHIDKAVFAQTWQKLVLSVSQKAGETTPIPFLSPDILALLSTQNPPDKVLNFVLVGIYAPTPENFMTESDKRRVVVLLKQIGSPYSAEQIEEHIKHTFLFTERVFRLFSELEAEPPSLPASVLQEYKQNLAKFYIHQLAKKYEVTYQQLITKLTQLWEEPLQQIRALLGDIEQARAQYEQLLEKKVSSGTLFKKLVNLEKTALTQWQILAQLAEDISELMQVTAVIEETGALERLAVFPVELFGCQPLKHSLSVQGLVDLFHQQAEASQNVGEDASENTVQEEIQAQTSELSPLNQKKAITQAKLGQMSALRTIESYKQFKMGQVLATLQEKK